MGKGNIIAAKLRSESAFAYDPVSAPLLVTMVRELRG
jgi:hypothetical protein